MPKTECAIVISSLQKPGTEAIKGDPFIIDDPGEYSISDIDITTFPIWHDSKEGTQHGQGIASIITAEEITLCHLGHIGTTLSDEEIETIGDIDVLFAPIGDEPLSTVTQALENINKIEPRMVIPYYSQNKSKNKSQDLLKKFAKEMGVDTASAQEKVTVKETTLPQDDMEVVILKPAVK